MERSIEDQETSERKLKQVFNDFADLEGKLSRKNVMEALQCLGYNPDKSQVDDWSLKFGGDFLDLTEFIQVVKSANEQSQPELEQIIESFAVFDQTGEGFLPIAQLKHLMCTNFGSESETLNEEDFNYLVSHLSKNDDDCLQYQDFAKMLSEKF